MKKILALGMVLGLLAAFGCAMAEVVSPSTATDLCAHANTRKVFYFDHPEYVSLTDYSHAVRGSAVVNTVCRDCGQVVRSERRENAELIRSHSYKKGVCLLCGKTEPDPKAPSPDELTVTTVAGDALDAAKKETEIRNADGDVAVVVPARVAGEAKQQGSALSTETLEEADGIYAALKIGGASPEADGISIRIYGRKIESVLFVGTEERKTVEEPAKWIGNDEPDGYSAVEWLGNGYYKFYDEQ